MSSHEKRVIAALRAVCAALAGLAGLVGESMMGRTHNGRGRVSRILGDITRGGASETYLACGRRLDESGCVEAMRLLHSRWDRLQRRAAELQADALNEHSARGSCAPWRPLARPSRMET